MRIGMGETMILEGRLRTTILSVRQRSSECNQEATSAPSEFAPHMETSIREELYYSTSLEAGQEAAQTGLLNMATTQTELLRPLADLLEKVATMATQQSNS